MSHKKAKEIADDLVELGAEIEELREDAKTREHEETQTISGTPES